VSNFRLAFFGVYHIGSLNGVVVRINPENKFRSGVEIDGLHSLLIIYHIHLFSGTQVVGSKFGSVGEQHDNIIIFGATHTTMSVRQLETLPTRAGVRAIQIGTDVRALMLIGLTFINVHAVFSIIG